MDRCGYLGRAPVFAERIALVQDALVRLHYACRTTVDYRSTPVDHVSDVATSTLGEALYVLGGLHSEHGISYDIDHLRHDLVTLHQQIVVASKQVEACSKKVDPGWNAETDESWLDVLAVRSEAERAFVAAFAALASIELDLGAEPMKRAS